MKTIIAITLFLILSVGIATAQQETPPAVNAGVGIVPPVQSPLTFWVDDKHYFVLFNNAPPGEYRGKINCTGKEKKEQVKLTMDDGSVFLYCKPPEPVTGE